MSKLNVRLGELTTKLQSARAASAINRDLDAVHARLSRAVRRRRRYGHLRELTEDSLRDLATSLGLDSWSDEPSEGTKVLSITGKIIVVDIGFVVATNEVKSCTLVLASEDGLQDEIFADGRDTMCLELLRHDFDAFSRDLEKLAFLDRHSDSSVGLNLFYVQDLLRDTVNRKCANKSGSGDKKTTMPQVSHLDMSVTYHQAPPYGTNGPAPRGETAGPSSHGQRYRASFEIEEQPTSANLSRQMVEGFSPEEALRHPVLRYPKTWLDSSNAWLPMKQFSASPFREDLRYTLTLEPALLLPRYLVALLAGPAPAAVSKVETAVGRLQGPRRRLVHSPDGPHHTETTILACTEEMVVLSRIAFAHPKEVEILLVDAARQHALLQQLLGSFDSEGSLEGAPFEDADLPCRISWSVKVDFLDDPITAIDQRKSIRLSIHAKAEDDRPVATVLIKPDATLECWHHSDASYFSSALSTVEDVPVALLATSERPRNR